MAVPLSAEHSGLTLELRETILAAQARWLKNNEVQEVLESFARYGLPLSTSTPDRPPGGTLFLFNKKENRFFRKDGHNWKKKGDGKTVKETHEKLKVGPAEVLNCYYAHADREDNLQRRCYWLLEAGRDDTVLVHYFNSSTSRAAMLEAAASKAPASKVPAKVKVPPKKREAGKRPVKKPRTGGSSSSEADGAEEESDYATDPDGGAGSVGLDRQDSDVSLVMSLPHSGATPGNAQLSLAMQWQMKQDAGGSPPLLPSPGIPFVSHSKGGQMAAAQAAAGHAGPPPQRFPSLGGAMLSQVSLNIPSLDTASPFMDEFRRSMEDGSALPSGAPAPAPSGGSSLVLQQQPAAAAAQAGQPGLLLSNSQSFSQQGSGLSKLFAQWAEGSAVSDPSLLAPLALAPVSSVPGHVADSGNDATSSPSSRPSPQAGIAFVGGQATPSAAAAGQLLEPSPLGGPTQPAEQDAAAAASGLPPLPRMRSSMGEAMMREYVEDLRAEGEFGEGDDAHPMSAIAEDSGSFCAAAPGAANAPGRSGSRALEFALATDPTLAELPTPVMPGRFLAKQESSAGRAPVAEQPQQQQQQQQQQRSERAQRPKGPSSSLHALGRRSSAEEGIGGAVPGVAPRRPNPLAPPHAAVRAAAGERSVAAATQSQHAQREAKITERRVIRAAGGGARAAAEEGAVDWVQAPDNLLRLTSFIMDPGSRAAAGQSAAAAAAAAVAEADAEATRGLLKHMSIDEKAGLAALAAEVEAEQDGTGGASPSSAPPAPAACGSVAAAQSVDGALGSRGSDGGVSLAGGMAGDVRRSSGSMDLGAPGGSAEITHVCPEWAFETGGSKLMLVLGSMAGLGSEAPLFVKFGDVVVPSSSVDKPGVLQCTVPAHPPGLTQICLTSGDGRPCSREVPFTFHPRGWAPQ